MFLLMACRARLNLPVNIQAMFVLLAGQVLRYQGALLQIPMLSSCCRLVKHSHKEDFWKRKLWIVFER